MSINQISGESGLDKVHTFTFSWSKQQKKADFRRVRATGNTQSGLGERTVWMEHAEAKTQNSKTI